MRRALVVSLLATVCTAPSVGLSQRVESFRELPLRINRDDRVRVVDQSGETIVGRVLRFGRDGLTIRTDAGERQVSEQSVRRVDRSSGSTARGALYGAASFVLVGAAVCSESRVGAACPFLFGAVFGAPLGALVGAWVPSMHAVYRAPNTPALARAATTDRTKASLLEELGLVVNLGDRLSVEFVSGGTVEGHLSRLGDDGFAISTEGGESREYTTATVRRVSVDRGRTRLGTLLGFAAFTALCLPSAGSDWPDAFVLCGLPGAGLGAIIGTTIRTSTVVYPATAARVSFSPAVVRDRLGVFASYRF